MIYTTRETINRRFPLTSLISRPASENAGLGDLWKGAELGIKGAAIGQKMPYFYPSIEWIGSQKPPVFSESGAISPARTRGDINESAEILITAAFPKPAERRRGQQSHDLKSDLRYSE